MANKNKIIFDVIANTSGYKEGFNETQKITEAATTAMKIGFAALVATATAATVAFGKFEKGMSNISTIIDNTTEDINNIGTEILALSKNIPKPISEMVDSMYDIRSAGVSAADAMETLNSSGRLAVVGLSSTKEATDILTTSINSFKSEGLSATEISNILFKTVKYGKNTISQLAQGFGQTAPIAKAAGLSLAEFSAATAALTAQGIPASVAQNQIRAAMVSLQKPTAEMQAIFAKLGYKDMKELLKNSKGVGDAFIKINKTATELNIPLVAATGRVEGANAITVLATEGAEIYSTALQDMASGADAVSVAFERQSATLDAQRQILMNMINQTFINLGSKFQPAIISASATAISLFESLNSVITKNGSLITEVFSYIVNIGTNVFNVVKDIAIAAANMFNIFGGVQILKIFAVIFNSLVSLIGIGASAIKTMATSLSGMLNDFGAFGTILKVTLGLLAIGPLVGFVGAIMTVVKATKAWKVAQLALNMVMSINPFFLLATAILGIAAVAYDVIVNFNEWRQTFTKLTNSMAIGWAKVKSLFASDETKKVLQDQIAELERENKAIDAQTEALKKRKDELKEQGKSSFEADRQAGKELDSGELKAQEAEKTAIKKEGENQRKAIETEAQADTFAQRQAFYESQKTLAADQFSNDLAAAKGNDEAKAKAREDYQNRLRELDEQFRTENIMIDDERKVIDQERETEFNQLMLEQKMENGLLEREAMAMQKEQEYQENLAREKKYQDTKLKMGKTYAEFERKLDQFYNNEAVKGFQENAGTLTKMADSKNSVLAGIGKTAAIAQIAMDTPKAAMSAYSSLAGIPIIGPALGVAAAAAAVAYGAEQMARVKSTSYAVGTDYVPSDIVANIHQGEGIIPAKENQFLQSGKLALAAPEVINSESNNQSNEPMNQYNISFEGANFTGSFNDDETVLNMADKIAVAIHEKRFAGFPS